MTVHKSEFRVIVMRLHPCYCVQPREFLLDLTCCVVKCRPELLLRSLSRLSLFTSSMND
jgi:hypothetical protein